MRVSGLLVKIFEVHGVTTVSENQGVADQSGTVVLDRSEEWVVNRRLDENSLAGRDEGSDQKVQGRDHAGSNRDPVRRDVPPMPPLHPVGYRLVVGARRRSVAVDWVLRPSNQGFPDRDGNRKVHVRHPHGESTVVSEESVSPFQVQVPGPFDELPLDRIRIPSIYFNVEVVLHLRPCPLLLRPITQYAS